MKYILMCGGNYHRPPKQLNIVKGEEIIKRTIRLLRENGVEDIAISSNNPIFRYFGLPVLQHKNTFGDGGHWIEGFYPINEPVCYIFGDVVFSPEAIKEIVETETRDIEFFASAPPFGKGYFKDWAEPYAFKVVNTELFQMSISMCIYMAEMGKFKRDPIAWELWQVIKNTPINEIDYTNYHVINDWTCDVDNENDLKKILEVMTD